MFYTIKDKNCLCAVFIFYLPNFIFKQAGRAEPTGFHFQSSENAGLMRLFLKIKAVLQPFQGMRFDILTIFPEAFDSYFNVSIVKRAQNKNKVKIKIHNLRDFASDKHKTVDGKPYGGGAGMVMKIEPIFKALKKINQKKTKRRKVVLLTPRGKNFTQKMAESLSKLDRIIFICGHYEGVDERVDKLVDEKISIGNYVLSGGELPAMIIVDAISRLIPGVLGNKESLKEESFDYPAPNIKSQTPILEYPQYTRPMLFSPKKGVNWKVPRILASGNHKEIKKWRDKHKNTIDKLIV